MQSLDVILRSVLYHLWLKTTSLVKSPGGIEMAQRVFAVLLVLFIFAGTAAAQNCSPYPNTLTNGQNADASQVMANFNWVLGCVNNAPPTTIDDTTRRNILLNTAFIAKFNGAYVRNINTFADGYAGSDGINAGSSSNYFVDATARNVAPAPVQTIVPGATGTPIGNAIVGGGLAAAFDGNTNKTQAQGSELGTSNSGYNNTIGKDWGSGNTKTISRFLIYGPSDATVVNSVATNCKLEGSTDNFASSIVLLATTATIPGSGYSSLTDTNSGITTTTAYRYHRINCNGNGTNGFSVAQVVFYESIGGSNMTLVTTSQTADANVANNRVLLEYTSAGAITLNTDLIVNVTCDNGSHWTNTTLTLVSSNVQAGHKLAETADTTCGTSGAVFAAKITTPTSKNVQIFKTTVTVH